MLIQKIALYNKKRDTYSLIRKSLIRCLAFLFLGIYSCIRFLILSWFIYYTQASDWKNTLESKSSVSVLPPFLVPVTSYAPHTSSLK